MSGMELLDKLFLFFLVITAVAEGEPPVRLKPMVMSHLSPLVTAVSLDTQHLENGSAHHGLECQKLDYGYGYIHVVH